MFFPLVVLGLVASALSQCPTVPECPCSDESTTDANYCQPVSTINVTMSDLAKGAPLCYTFLPNTPPFNQLDNVCITMFPGFNNTEEYIVYLANVYIDGSLLIEMFIGRTNGTGISVWTKPDRTLTNYVLGYADCGTYVLNRCGDCGDTDKTPYVFGLSPTFNSSESAQSQMQMLTLACQQQALNIAEAQGLCTDNIYVLPNNLPGQCVYQQRCQPQGSPVYCQQEGSCQPY